MHDGLPSLIFRACNHHHHVHMGKEVVDVMALDVCLFAGPPQVSEKINLEHT